MGGVPGCRRRRCRLKRVAVTDCCKGRGVALLLRGALCLTSGRLCCRDLDLVARPLQGALPGRDLRKKAGLVGVCLSCRCGALGELGLLLSDAQRSLLCRGEDALKAAQGRLYAVQSRRGGGGRAAESVCRRRVCRAEDEAVQLCGAFVRAARSLDPRPRHPGDQEVAENRGQQGEQRVGAGAHRPQHALGVCTERALHTCKRGRDIIIICKQGPKWLKK